VLRLVVLLESRWAHPGKRQRRPRRAGRRRPRPRRDQSGAHPLAVLPRPPTGYVRPAERQQSLTLAEPRSIMEAVTQLDIDLARLDEMSAAERLAVVEQETLVGDVHRVNRQRPAFAERLARR